MKRLVPALLILLCATMLNGCGFIGVIIEAIAGVAGGAAGGAVSSQIGGAAGSKIGGAVGSTVSSAVMDKGTEMMANKNKGSSGSHEESVTLLGKDTQ